MTDILIQFLDLEGQKVAIRPLSSGHINDTFHVGLVSLLGDKADFVLQRLNTAIFPEPNKIMGNMALVAAHLQQKGYAAAVLTVIPTQKGALFFTDEAGHAWRLMPYFGSTYTLETLSAPAQAHEAAGAFGSYVSALADMPLDNLETIIPNFHDADFRQSQFVTALSGAEKMRPMRYHQARDWASAVLSALADITAAWPSLPLRATHNDTKISNVLFDENTHKAVCIIDLDTLQPGTILSDFGDMVRTYTSTTPEDTDPDNTPVEMQKAYFEALARGFIAATAAILTAEERQALLLGAKKTILVQSMRFLTDYLNGDTYYKTAYAEHNWIRARNQWALFQSLVRQEADFQQILDTIFDALT